MKTSKKILSVLLSALFVLLSVSALATVSFAADGIAAYGPCGDNINWSYADGTLTLSGQGVLQPQIVQFPLDNLNFQPQTGAFTTETKTLNARSFPWYPALEDQLAKKYGYADAPTLKHALNAGVLDAKTYYRELYQIIRSIVIEEGITSIPEAAFSVSLAIPYLPRTIYLPATLTDLDDDALNAGMAQKIVISNPSLALRHSITLAGFTDANAAPATPDALMNTDAMAASKNAETAVYLLNVLLALNEQLAQRDLRIAEAEQIENEKARAAALAEIQNEESEQTALANRYFLTRSATADGTVKELLARVNTKLGLSLKNVQEIGAYTPAVFDEEGTLVSAAQTEFSPAVAEKIAAMQSAAAALVNAPAAYSFVLGEAPQAVVSDGAGGQTVVALTSAPWVTIYGAQNSTAQTAAAVSKVKFLPLTDETSKPEQPSDSEDVLAGGFSGLLQRIINAIRTLVNRIKEMISGGFSLED